MHKKLLINFHTISNSNNVILKINLQISLKIFIVTYFSEMIHKIIFLPFTIKNIFFIYLRFLSFFI